MTVTKALRTLHVPDLFAGILSGEPVENPHESQVASESEAWSKKSVFDSSFTSKNNRGICV
jgi:hypothetical protein